MILFKNMRVNKLIKRFALMIMKFTFFGGIFVRVTNPSTLTNLNTIKSMKLNKIVTTSCPEVYLTFFARVFRFKL